MFDLGWSEMLLIGIVALIVVGPKELPGLFRNVGIWVGKARGVARESSPAREPAAAGGCARRAGVGGGGGRGAGGEFSRAGEWAADESGVRDIERSIRAAANPV